MIFYDFEVFKYDWLVVAIDADHRKEHVIVNNPDELLALYKAHRDDIWVGYNSRSYDQWIFKAILCGFNPKEINDWIIVQDRKGFEFSRLLNNFPLINYDTIPNPPIGLKVLEGFMGNNIKETEVPFDIDRPLTKKEIDQTIFYCRHDVEQTAEVFIERIEVFKSSLELIKLFDLPIDFIGKTESQLTAEILECVQKSWDDEWDIHIFDTIRLGKYQYIGDWYMDPSNHDYSKKLEVNVAGVPHVFAWGGLHGAVPKYHHKGLLLHVDVNSYYPSILIKYGIMSRASKNPQKYADIYYKRLKLKAEGKKQEQEPYKKVLNATSGAMKARFNKLYDPRNNNLMCINGQLMLLDLIDKLEGHCDLIQSNTDGLIIAIDDTDEAFEKIDDLCYEWEQRTGMGLKLDVINEIFQKDVNNYLWIDEKGEVKRIGAYCKELSRIDYDLPILNKAVVDYMTKGIPVEITINSCDNLIDFQKIVKLSNSYEYISHNGKAYSNKCYRVFASTRSTDGKIERCKHAKKMNKETGRNEEYMKHDKFGNTADHCFIFNDDINGVECPSYLDRDWYIEKANQHLQDFGVAV